LVFSQLENNAGTRMVAMLDKAEYLDKDLIEVKVPVNLPYQTNWNDFERYDGEVEIAGVHYNYVKRKLQNDTLILMCIPNTDKMNLLNARETFFSLVNDVQQSESGKQLPLPVKPVKIFMAECVPDQNDFFIAGPTQMDSEYCHINNPAILSIYQETQQQPPEQLS
jgi:hypothetical protein